MALIDQTKDIKARQTSGSRCSGMGTICLALLASACNNQDRIDAKPTSKAVQTAELFLSPAESEGLQYLAAYDKQIQVSADALVRVKKGMEALLFDPTSAQYSAIRVGRN